MQNSVIIEENDDLTETEFDEMEPLIVTTENQSSTATLHPQIIQPVRLGITPGLTPGLTPRLTPGFAPRSTTRSMQGSTPRLTRGLTPILRPISETTQTTQTLSPTNIITPHRTDTHISIPPINAISSSYEMLYRFAAIILFFLWIIILIGFNLDFLNMFTNVGPIAIKVFESRITVVLATTGAIGSIFIVCYQIWLHCKIFTMSTSQLLCCCYLGNSLLAIINQALGYTYIKRNDENIEVHQFTYYNHLIGMGIIIIPLFCALIPIHCNIIRL